MSCPVSHSVLVLVKDGSKSKPEDEPITDAIDEDRREAAAAAVHHQDADAIVVVKKMKRFDFQL